MSNGVRDLIVRVHIFVKANVEWIFLEQWIRNKDSGNQQNLQWIIWIQKWGFIIVSVINRVILNLLHSNYSNTKSKYDKVYIKNVRWIFNSQSIRYIIYCAKLEWLLFIIHWAGNGLNTIFIMTLSAIQNSMERQI